MKTIVLLITIILATISVRRAQALDIIEFTLTSNLSNVFLQPEEGAHTVIFTMQMRIENTSIPGEFSPSLWIDQSVFRGTSTDPNTGISFILENGSDQEVTTGNVDYSYLERTSGGSMVGNYIRIDPGQNARFVFEVWYTPLVTDTYRLQLWSVNWNDAQAPEAHQYFLDNSHQSQAHVVQGSIPEPSSALLLLLGLGASLRRKRT